MREWRSLEQKVDDEPVERGLRLEAWGFILALALVFLIALKVFLQ